MFRTREEYLEKFAQYAKQSKFNTTDYPWCYLYDGEQLDFQLHISSIIHGNEIGSLSAVLAIIEKLENKTLSFQGRICITLGNPEACLLDKRFIDSDLNRVFLDAYTSPHPNHLLNHECQRAHTLMTIFDTSDMIMDLHQTILPSQEPFYICPTTPTSLLWARAIGTCRRYVDATPTSATPSYRCADEYFWAQGKVALTIELGQNGCNDIAHSVALDSILRAMTIIETIHTKHTSISEIANTQPEIELYETAHREPYHTAEYQLEDGFINFSSVAKGQPLHSETSPELYAPTDGYLLFPKYPERHPSTNDTLGPPIDALPKEIYRIVRKIER
jgi:succinylglutamate desuccinylase